MKKFILTAFISSVFIPFVNSQSVYLDKTRNAFSISTGITNHELSNSFTAGVGFSIKSSVDLYFGYGSTEQKIMDESNSQDQSGEILLFSVQLLLASQQRGNAVNFIASISGSRIELQDISGNSLGVSFGISGNVNEMEKNKIIPHISGFFIPISEITNQSGRTVNDFSYGILGGFGLGFQTKGSSFFILEPGIAYNFDIEKPTISISLGYIF